MDSLRRSGPSRAPERYSAQLLRFCREMFLVDEPEICDVHVMAFLVHCVNRPVVRDERGQLVEGPLRNGLSTLVEALSVYYRCVGISPITKRVRRFAAALREQYGRPPRLAEPLTLEGVRDFISAMNRRPLGLRNKAVLLLLCETWCRPGELLALDYPGCVRGSGDGIVVTFAHCKADCGEPHFVPVAHARDPDLCPICALKVWIDYLGPGYVGPLFPSLRQGRPRPASLSTSGVTSMLRSLAKKSGRNPDTYSSYSTRRGSATIAASEGWELSAIQRKLWHAHVGQTLHYIGIDALMGRTRSVLDP